MRRHHPSLFGLIRRDGKQTGRQWERVFKPSEVYVDVGANIGHLSIEAALLAGSAEQVYAFEGHPRICAHLRENVALNRLSNVRIAQIAIGDTGGWTRFSDYHADDMNRVDSRSPIAVLMLPLDLILSELSLTLHYSPEQGGT